jgi:hypothetical protein
VRRIPHTDNLSPFYLLLADLAYVVSKTRPAGTENNRGILGHVEINLIHPEAYVFVNISPDLLL